MDNLYQELKDRQQTEFNQLPLMFAFSNEQFAEGMKKLGLTAGDTDKIYSIGAGGYIKKADAPLMHDMINRHDAEFQAAINDRQTGDTFIFDMFDYELANHEYSYTGDVSETLDALGLTVAEVRRNPRLLNGLRRAIKAQYEEESVNA